MFFINLILSILICYIYCRLFKKKKLSFYFITIFFTFLNNFILLYFETHNFINIFSFNIEEKIIYFLNCIFTELSLLNIIYKNDIKTCLKTNNLKKYLIIIPIIISLVLFFELFIFNFRHYESFNNKEIKLKINNSKNIDKIDKNTYSIKNNNYIEFTNINEEINNLYFEIISPGKFPININIEASDEANELYFSLPKRIVVNDIINSHYIKMNLSGKTKKLKINFDTNFNKSTNSEVKPFNLNIKKIIINKQKPILISKLRILILFLFIYILFVIRPKSELYKYKLKDFKYKKLVILLYIILQCLFFTILVNLNPAFGKHNIFPNQHQYEELAISLSNKKVTIDATEGKILKKLKNPYDFFLRKKVLEENNESYLFDHAYYKGKYYVYFGIVPCIIFYLPYYLITGNHMSNYLVILIMLFGITIVILKLLELLVNRYFKNISLLHYLLLSVLFINCCGLLYIAKRPDFYSVPIVCALFFSLLGLFLWMSSIKESKINKLKLILGSLSMALVAGCRPQFLLSSFFSLLIFKDFIFDKNISNREKIKNFILFCIPYIIIASIIMYYNYIRFDSPFDFGANYNLTGNDMTKRGFHFDRIFLGIYYFLFSTTTITPTFPFVSYQQLKTNYMGMTIYENFWGGLIFNNLILIFGILSFKFKNLIKNKTLYSFTVLCTIFAIIIVIVDTQIAGILPRYITDFAWLLFIPTCVVIFSILEFINKNKKYKLVFNYIFISLFLISIFYNFIIIPTDLAQSILEYRPSLYYKLYNLVQFWL